MKQMNYFEYETFAFSFHSEDRIRNGAKKLAKARTITQQGRLDSFFAISHTVSTTITKKTVRISLLKEYEQYHQSLPQKYNYRSRRGEKPDDKVVYPAAIK